MKVNCLVIIEKEIEINIPDDFLIDEHLDDVSVGYLKWTKQKP